MHGHLVLPGNADYRKVYFDALIAPIIVEAGLSVDQYTIGDTTDLLPLNNDCVVICLGLEPFEAITGQRYLESFAKLQGTSVWVDGRRVVLTYSPEHVIEHTSVFRDFYNSLTIPVRYPILDKPVVHIRSQVVPPGWEALDLIERTIRANPGIYTFDIETSGFNPRTDRILCISIGYNGSGSWVLTEDSWNDSRKVAIWQKLFSNPDIHWVAHNGKFDIRFIRHHLGVVPYLRHDTMLLHYILDERIGTHGLKLLCSTRLALPDYEAELHKYLRRKADSYDTIPKPVLYKYAGQDTCFTYRLYDQLMREIKDSPFYANLWQAYGFVMEASNVLGDIETHGFVMDRQALDAVEHTLTAQCEAAEAQLAEIVGTTEFNPRSPKQVAAYLYDICRFDEVKLFRNKKKRVTSAEALKKLLLEHPKDAFLQTLLHYRETKKILSTYVIAVREAIDDDGRLRTDFKIHGTVTGRLSSSKPNLQNIPRPKKNESAKLIRNLFTVPEGSVIVGADYSQAELRVVAVFSGEEWMRNVWLSGTDLHTMTCLDLFGNTYTSEDRMIAKMLNFGVVYGRTAGSIAVERGISMLEATRLYNKFFDSKPKLRKWLDETRDLAESQGYLITPVGRMRRFDIFTADNTWRQLNQSANFKVSSTASDCCLLAAMRLHYWLRETGKGQILLLVHDSIYVECRKEWAAEVSAKLEECMLDAGRFILGTDWIELAVDTHVATRWGDL